MIKQQWSLKLAHKSLASRVPSSVCATQTHSSCAFTHEPVSKRVIPAPLHVEPQPEKRLKPKQSKRRSLNFSVGDRRRDEEEEEEEDSPLQLVSVAQSVRLLVKVKTSPLAAPSRFSVALRGGCAHRAVASICGGTILLSMPLLRGGGVGGGQPLQPDRVMARCSGATALTRSSNRNLWN
ncbi:unnamed protein product [Pleuronectes platessa]|uniref:Uncharacterized protein n=1 Tax=Pleuronectes platessa TaxID=8262 RepID=A0A9N7TGU4_PLEPL|nr:unnamed protein product [Pleuronectes platessa]